MENALIIRLGAVYGKVRVVYLWRSKPSGRLRGESSTDMGEGRWGIFRRARLNHICQCEDYCSIDMLPLNRLREDYSDEEIRAFQIAGDVLVAAYFDGARIEECIIGVEI